MVFYQIKLCSLYKLTWIYTNRTEGHHTQATRLNQLHVALFVGAGTVVKYYSTA